MHSSRTCATSSYDMTLTYRFVLTTLGKKLSNLYKSNLASHSLSVIRRIPSVFKLLLFISVVCIKIELPTTFFANVAAAKYNRLQNFKTAI